MNFFRTMLLLAAMTALFMAVGVTALKWAAARLAGRWLGYSRDAACRLQMVFAFKPQESP